MTRTALVLTLLGSAAAIRDEDFLKITSAQQIHAASSGGGSTDIGYGKLADKEGVWGDTPKAEFIEVPAWMVGLSLAKPSHKVSGGTTLTWSCPLNPPDKGCSCFIFQYSCAGCTYNDGDLDNVLSSEWKLIKCAPKFRIDYSPTIKEAHHPMIAYRKYAAAGEQVEVYLPKDTDYILIGGDKEKQLVDCGSLGDEAKCEHADLLGQCEWDVDTCISRTCITKWKGPVGGPPGGLGAYGPPGPPGAVHNPGSCKNRCVGLDIPLGMP